MQKKQTRSPKTLPSTSHLRVQKKSSPCKWFECTYSGCAYGTVRKFDFDAHVRIHTNEKPFPCPYCDYKGRLKIQIRDHIRKNHPNKPYKSSAIIQEKTMNCEICNYSTTDPKSWRFHHFIHTREKPFGCNVCGFVCESSGILEKHEQTHVIFKKKCDICGKRFESKKVLIIHMKTIHKKCEFGSTCPFCDYVTKNLYLMRNHILIHSNEKRFKCRICDYKSKQAQSLRYHMKRIHNAKPSKSHIQSVFNEINANFN